MSTAVQNPPATQPAPSATGGMDALNLAGTTPGIIRVIKRNGTVVPYDGNKVIVAVTKAFLAVEGQQAAGSERIKDVVEKIATKITDTFNRRWPGGGTIHIEAIQDQVELTLMSEEQHQVARAYVIHREDHRKAREAAEKSGHDTKKIINITLHDGAQKPLDVVQLSLRIEEACKELEDVDSALIIKDTLRNIYDGITMNELNTALVMATRTLIETDPNYSFVAARLLLNQAYNEGLMFLGLPTVDTHAQMSKQYGKCFKEYIARGVQLELLNPGMQDFDLNKLSKAIDPSKDFLFTYLGLQTLYDRYFIHYRETRFELPQVFFMRVAMGLAINETGNREDRAIEFYQLLSSFDYMSSTPTLFNSGTRHSQLSSCYLTTVPDDLNGIYSAINDNAMLSKYAGGLGNDWTNVRSMGAQIKGTNGKSSGVVPFLNVADATAVAVNQGGKRKGAVCAYLETWHMDIEDFLELRKNTGDERRRTHDMNTANWIPDLFMQRVFEEGEWTLFSPDETPDLHDLYGEAFTKAYTAYEEKAKKGEIRFKTVSAVTLWRKMLAMVFETGHPWMTFKDACNLRSPQQHAGVIHSSNLCTEITLNTSEKEIAVCNLGSINLLKHTNKDGLDVEKLKKTIKTAIRMLDNVIDINYYSVPQAEYSNMLHRPIGLGLMGFQDALYAQGIPYSSKDAVEFADISMELISYYAIQASSELAKERGSYSSYEGSLWSQDILPIDSIQILKKARGKYLQQNTNQRLDWSELRKTIKANGMRNSNVMAIAPTATISNICGVAQSIEPTYQNLFVKSNLSGEFTVINPHLVKQLKAEGLWDEVMINDLKYYDGSLQKIGRIPDHIKTLYATAFEIEPRWMVDAASRRQKWIDQGQSLNLYMAEPSGKKLDVLYRMAWLSGLKTTYYLRSLGATNAEKSTVTDGALNAVSANAAPKACSIDDPDCEACQ